MTDYEKNLFETRYRKDESEKSWNDVFKRVADTIGKTDEDKKEYYDLMSEGWFLPSSPQLWNFGAGNNSGSSCFTMHIGDTLEEIYQADWEACQVYKSSGGCGYNLSPIRPRGSVIHGSPNNSVGVLPIVEKLESTTAYLTAGGRDRGALMLQLDVIHPDMLEFIFCKKPIKMLVNGIEQWDIPFQNVNISVRCSDKFMQAVENDDMWEFSWSDERQEFKIKTWEQLHNNLKIDDSDFKDVNRQRFYKFILLPVFERFKGKIKAKQIWTLINENAHSFADPGIVFTDNIEKYNPHPQLGVLHSNPCQEFYGPDYSSCNLGSMNLRKFFINGKFDWEEYSNKICLAVRYLNDVLDYNVAPIEKINEVTKNVTRPIGLGVMKFADLLILENIRYGSEEAIKYAKDLMAFTTATAWQESFNLGRERKHPSSWNKEKMIEIFLSYGKECSLGFVQNYDQLIERIEKGEIATNSVVTSLAPTGSISKICSWICGYNGESSGIEPIFSKDTQRVDASGRTKESHDLLPDKKEKWHVTAMEIPPNEHVKMLGAFAKFTSMSVSKTINLKEDATVKDVEDAYLLAWKLGVKGTTVYRDKSKPFQVLSSLDRKVEKEVNLDEFKIPDQLEDERSDRLYGYTEKIPVANGNMYLTINSQLSEDDYWSVREILQNRGRMAEVFISYGKAGTDVSGYLQAIARLISLDLRKGNGHITLDDVLETIEGISFAPSWYKSKLTQSPVDAIVKSINRERELREKAMGKGKEEKKKKEVKGESCSVCGKEYRYTDGCRSCACSSKCG